MSDCDCEVEIKNRGEGKVLYLLLAINGVMFCAEFIAGWLAESTGLIADSLDMFADALVYAVALYAVGKTIIAKSKAAFLSGILHYRHFETCNHGKRTDISTDDHRQFYCLNCKYHMSYAVNETQRRRSAYEGNMDLYKK
jgi:hypothetical protein